MQGWGGGNGWGANAFFNLCYLREKRESGAGRPLRFSLCGSTPYTYMIDKALEESIKHMICGYFLFHGMGYTRRGSRRRLRIRSSSALRMKAMFTFIR